MAGIHISNIANQFIPVMFIDEKLDTTTFYDPSRRSFLHPSKRMQGNRRLHRQLQMIHHFLSHEILKLLLSIITSQTLMKQIEQKIQCYCHVSFGVKRTRCNTKVWRSILSLVSNSTLAQSSSPPTSSSSYSSSFFLSASSKLA